MQGVSGMSLLTSNSGCLLSGRPQCVGQAVPTPERALLVREREVYVTSQRNVSARDLVLLHRGSRLLFIAPASPTENSHHHNAQLHNICRVDHASAVVVSGAL